MGSTPVNWEALDALIIDLVSSETAIDILRSHAPFVLHDNQILFRLQKQKFIELLKKGTHEDRDATIGCLRTSVAPCSLAAYPGTKRELGSKIESMGRSLDENTEIIQETGREVTELRDGTAKMEDNVRCALDAVETLASKVYRIEGNQVSTSLQREDELLKILGVNVCKLYSDMKQRARLKVLLYIFLSYLSHESFAEILKYNFAIF